MSFLWENVLNNEVENSHFQVNSAFLPLTFVLSSFPPLENFIIPVVYLLLLLPTSPPVSGDLVSDHKTAPFLSPSMHLGRLLVTGSH